jgi:hypothetical protein
MTEAAAAAGVPVETLRKIEAGRIATPAFFTVAALAAAVGLPLADVVASCAAGSAPLAKADGREEPVTVRGCWNTGSHV